MCLDIYVQKKKTEIKVKTGFKQAREKKGKETNLSHYQR